MRRDRRVAAAVEQRLQCADEGVAHLLVVVELDRLRLDVDPLAEPHARAGKRGRIRVRAPERGLRTGPTRACPSSRSSRKSRSVSSVVEESSMSIRTNRFVGSAAAITVSTLRLQRP